MDISADGYYVALNASNVWHLVINEHLKYHKINNQINLTKNDKFSEISILHHISAVSPSCWYDAITLFVSLDSLKATLTLCSNLELLRFSVSKLFFAV